MIIKEAIKRLDRSCELNHMTKDKSIFKGITDGEIRKVMFLCNHATYFHSHRLEIARTLIKHGLDVSLFCGSKVSDESVVYSKIQAENIRLFRQMHLSGSTNVKSILQFVIQFFKIII